MSLYQTLVRLHIVATAGPFAGLGVEVPAPQRVQRTATSSEARAWLPALQNQQAWSPTARWSCWS